MIDLKASEAINIFADVRSQVKDSKKLLDGPVNVSYGKVFAESDILAQHFQEKNLQVGDRVLLAVKKDSNLVVMVLAMLNFGLRVVVVDGRSTPTEIQDICKKAKVSGIIADKEILKKLQVSQDVFSLGVSSKKNTKLFSKLLKKKTFQEPNSQDYPDILKNYSDVPIFQSRASEGTVVLTTSGTTGQMKLVELSMETILVQVNSMARQLQLKEEDKIFHILPLSHVDGLINGVLMAFLLKASLCRPLEFTTQGINEIIDALYQFRINCFVVTPVILALILKLGENLEEGFDLPDLRCIVSTASSLSKKLWEDFEKVTGKKLVNMYGMTEGNNLFFSGPDAQTRKVGTIGKAIDCEAKLVDEKGEFAGAGEVGELWVRGPALMKSYLEGEGDYQKEWFATGDLAQCDSDGFYQIMGRKKNIIISGGMNISPEEINKVLLVHKEILEAETIGVKDPIWEEKVISYVVSSNPGLKELDVAQHLRENLSEYKIPKQVVFLTELPRGRSGKVQRQELEKLALEKVEIATKGESCERVVLEIAAGTFSVAVGDLNLATNIKDCESWTSLAHLEFITRLEKHFSITIEPTDIITINTLGKAVNVVETKLVHA